MNLAQRDRHERQLRKYNLTEEQFQALWDACNGHCPACGKVFSTTRLACVDHNHETGLVRGLLCTPCNNEIGMHHDNAVWFRNVADYLDNPPAIVVIGEVYVPGSIGAHRERQ